MTKTRIIGLAAVVITLLITILAVFWNEATSNIQRITNTLPSLVGDEVIADDLLDSHALVSSTPSGTLTEEERLGLLQMREEEKLAHDVYVFLGDYWKQQVFINISKSEQTHTDAVKNLLHKYGIEDPATQTVGTFTDPALQKLYGQLIEEGKKSLADALQVGALIEDLDIFDLNTLIKNTTNADIQLVYGNLLRGSKNHIRSFTRVIKNFGGTYKPSYIDQALYNEIISAQQTTGSPKNDRANNSKGRRGGGQGRML